MPSWPGPVTAITLVAEDLAATKAFYQEVFNLPVKFEDDDSVVFDFGNTLVNLLAATAAPELVHPASVASAYEGVRFQLTLAVEDVDATSARLRDHGVRLLTEPTDRPWGVRTASFRDPAGHIWEIATRK